MSDQFSRAFGHVPVLGKEAVEALAPFDGGKYIDATLGGGGYSRQILGAAGCQLFAFDRDPVAIERAAAWSGAYAGRLTLLPHPFAEMDTILQQIGVSEVQGVVFDLGVSSVQLDEAQRGFSFQQDGPLNMRMDQQVEQNAAELVNNASEKDLADIFYIYGEEKKSHMAAKAIVAEREQRPITTTGQLSSILLAAFGDRGSEKIHPATRVFQAIRIFVNDELGQLVRGLLAAEKLLAPAGRLAVVTFHSLEDRIVKRFLSLRSRTEEPVSRHQPKPGNSAEPTFSLLHRKPVVPSKEEQEENPRARSAKLRVGVRTSFPVTGVGEKFYQAVGVPRLTLSRAISHWR